MPRMFDILRGKIAKDIKEDKKEDKEEIKKPSYVDFPDINKREEIKSLPKVPLSFPKNILQLEVKKEKSPESRSIISEKLISAMKQHGVDNQEKAREIYEGAVDTIKVLL
jgi:hypothetical protein